MELKQPCRVEYLGEDKEIEEDLCSIYLDANLHLVWIHDHVQPTNVNLDYFHRRSQEPGRYLLVAELSSMTEKKIFYLQ